MGCCGFSGNSSNSKKSKNVINSNRESSSKYQNKKPTKESSEYKNKSIKTDTQDVPLQVSTNTDGNEVELRDAGDSGEGSSSGNKAQSFTYQELVEATDNFRPDSFIGEGGFGKVYKGHLKTGEAVAIKQLDRSGSQGMHEFVVEVATLGNCDHPNLVKLIGFCCEGDQRLLVYEYMPLGSLETHLHDLKPKQKPLDWNTRMQIAAGAARGLEYLHVQRKPPFIYRDLKCSNILLGEGYHPKLSDFGLVKVGPSGDQTHVSTRVMGTYGYCAPDYAMTGQLTFKSDIYSFGVVLLEIITGRMAVDPRKDRAEQYLVAWARPLFRDRKKFPILADPLLKGEYPSRGLYQALAIAAMCVQEKPDQRPVISEVVNALNYLANKKYDPSEPDVQSQRHRRTSSSPGNKSADVHSQRMTTGGHRSSDDNELRRSNSIADYRLEE